jgi:ribonucleoside-diphosphate reductase beta chain
MNQLPSSDILALDLDKKIFNVAKTDYNVPRLFFGQEPGLLDSIHKYYPKLWSLFKKLRKQDWDEEEFDFSVCKEEFQTCPPHIYNRMINNLIWQWEGDSVASRSIAAIMAPFCSAVEVWVPFVRINDNENVHGLTYSDMVKGSFENPDAVLAELLAKIEPMRRLVSVGKVFSKAYHASHKYALGEIEADQELHNTVYMFLVAMLLLERVQFMVSFAETFDICRKGYFPPIRAAVEKIAMDEFEIHAQFGMEVLKVVLATPEGALFYAQCRDQIIALIKELHAAEIEFIRWNRADGNYEGFMTTDEAIAWLGFNATAACVFLGITEEDVGFKFVTKNPIPWIKSHMNISDNQASPQEEDANSYMVNIFRRDDQKVIFKHNHPALANLGLVPTPVS